MLVAGWLLNEDDRAELLSVFPPIYRRVVAHHVTLKSRVSQGYPLPKAMEGYVVGIADDGEGVQALVVEIAGTTHRPDGSTYHITWSLADCRNAVESNDVIRKQGWEAVGRRRIRLEPKVFSP